MTRLPCLKSVLSRLVLMLAAGMAACFPAFAESPQRVGDIVTFKIDGTFHCDDSAGQIQLLLNGLDSGLRSIGCDPAMKSIAFRLSPRDLQANADAAWTALLGDPWNTPKGSFAREVRMTLAKHNPETKRTEPILSTTRSIGIVRVEWLIIGGGLVAAAWLALVLFGRRSGMLRDSNSTATANDRPYSLARVQMAWWFGLTLGAYVLLWMLTDTWAQLNSSVLALMGVSGVTGLAAAGIDSAPGREVPHTQGLLHDILTDANGITLPRLQLLLWNLVLGVFFISRVLTDLKMPTFDTATLGLLGISAGAYLGFKVPEKQNASPDPVKPKPDTDTDPKAAYTPQ